MRCKRTGCRSSPALVGSLSRRVGAPFRFGGAATERGSGNPSRRLSCGDLQPVRVGVHQRGDVTVEIALIRQSAAGPTVLEPTAKSRSIMATDIVPPPTVARARNVSFMPGTKNSKRPAVARPHSAASRSAVRADGADYAEGRHRDESAAVTASTGSARAVGTAG